MMNVLRKRRSGKGRTARIAARRPGVRLDLLLALGMLLPAAHLAAADTAPAATPAHIRQAADLIDDVVPQYSTIVQARKRLEARGLFCTWGGSQLVESVGARFLLCSLSCAQSSTDGWWVYLSEVVGKGVQYIEVGQAAASIIKPYLPDGCPERPAGAALPAETR